MTVRNVQKSARMNLVEPVCSKLLVHGPAMLVTNRPGAIPNPESESKDKSGFHSRFGIIVESDLESESCRFESELDS